MGYLLVCHSLGPSSVATACQRHALLLSHFERTKWVAVLRSRAPAATTDASLHWSALPSLSVPCSFAACHAVGAPERRPPGYRLQQLRPFFRHGQ